MLSTERLFCLTYILVSEASKYVFVMSRITHKSSLEKSNVENGGIEIDELEYEDLESQVVVEFRLRTVHLCKKEDQDISLN